MSEQESLITEVGWQLPEPLQDEPTVERFAQLCQLNGGWPYLGSYMIDAATSGPMFAAVSRLVRDPYEPDDERVATSDELERQVLATDYTFQSVLRLSDTLAGDVTLFGEPTTWPVDEVLPPTVTAQQQDMLNQAEQLLAEVPPITPQELAGLDAAARREWLHLAQLVLRERRAMTAEAMALSTLKATIAVVDGSGQGLRDVFRPYVRNWQADLQTIERQRSIERYARGRAELVSKIIHSTAPFLENVYHSYNMVFVGSRQVHAQRQRDAAFWATTLHMLPGPDAQAMATYATREVKNRQHILDAEVEPDDVHARKEQLMPAVVATLLPRALLRSWDVPGVPLEESWEGAEAYLAEHMQRLDRAKLLEAKLGPLREEVMQYPDEWRRPDELNAAQLELYDDELADLDDETLSRALELVLAVDATVWSARDETAAALRASVTAEQEQYDAALAQLAARKVLPRDFDLPAGRPFKATIEHTLARWEIVQTVLLRAARAKGHRVGPDSSEYLKLRLVEGSLRGALGDADTSAESPYPAR